MESESDKMTALPPHSTRPSERLTLNLSTYCQPWFAVKIKWFFKLNESEIDVMTALPGIMLQKILIFNISQWDLEKKIKIVYLSYQFDIPWRYIYSYAWIVTKPCLKQCNVSEFKYREGLFAINKLFNPDPTFLLVLLHPHFQPINLKITESLKW